MRSSGWLAALALSCGADERVVVGRDLAPQAAGASGSAGQAPAGAGSAGSGVAGSAGGAGGAGAAQAGAAGPAGTAGASGSAAELCGPEGAQVTCGAGEFCDHDDKACGREAPGGRCLPRPALLVCPGECNPVCACDGKVYCNECVANNAGTDADPKGPCP